MEGLGVQYESTRRESTPKLVFTNEIGEQVQQVQVSRRLSPEGSGSEYETAEEGAGWTSADDELQDRTGPEPGNQTRPQLRDQTQPETGTSKTSIGLGSGDVGPLETEEKQQDKSEPDPCLGPDTGLESQTLAGYELDSVLGLDLKVHGSAGPGPDGLDCKNPDPVFEFDIFESSSGSAPGFDADPFAESKPRSDPEDLDLKVQGSAGVSPDGPGLDLQIPDPGFVQGFESDPFRSSFSSAPGFDGDPFAESKAGFGPDLFGFGTTGGFDSDPFAGEAGLGLGSLPESGLHSDEDEVANQRLGTLYQELEQDQVCGTRTELSRVDLALNLISSPKPAPVLIPVLPGSWSQLFHLHPHLHQTVPPQLKSSSIQV